MTIQKKNPSGGNLLCFAITANINANYYEVVPQK